MAASYSVCALCPGARAYELVPCCWCTNWIHVKCSYAVPEGRARAAHLDVINPLDKQVVESMGDESIPEYFRGRSVCPNIAAPRTIETSVAPKHVMYGIEALWMYKHAWRGASLYDRKGDHQVPKSETAEKPPSMYKALGMYPVWDKWLMPRWDDFLADKEAGKISEDEKYEPVTNFDPRFHYYDNYIDIVGYLPETSTRAEEEAKCSMWELEGLELELSLAKGPESFASRVLNPKKRKPDPETDGEGLPQHPTAKRKSDGASEKSKGSVSASPSASQEPPTMDLETQSEAHSLSTSGIVTEAPHARPTHTPSNSQS